MTSNAQVLPFMGWQMFVQKPGALGCSQMASLRLARNSFSGLCQKGRASCIILQQIFQKKVARRARLDKLREHWRYALEPQRYTLMSAGGRLLQKWFSIFLKELIVYLIFQTPFYPPCAGVHPDIHPRGRSPRHAGIHPRLPRPLPTRASTLQRGRPP